MPPLPPGPPPQRPDTSDAFFQSFDSSNSPIRPTNRIGGPPQPPPQRQPGPPPAGPPQPPYRPQPPPQRPQPPPARPAPPPAANYLLSSGNNSQSQQQQQPQSSVGGAYYSNTGMSAAPHQQPQQQAHYQTPVSPYGTTSHVQAAPNAPLAQNNNNNNDWYNPSPTGSVGTYGAGILPTPTIPASMPSFVPPVYGSSQLDGTMDTSNRNNNGPFPPPQQQQSSAPLHSMFIPQQPPSSTDFFGGGANNNNDLSSYQDHDEVPLLEELGINVEHIMAKTKAVVVPFRRFHQRTALADPSMIVEDADLAGPIAFALLLGGELLMSGKLQFGYIYGFGLFGCMAMTLILNLMSPTAVSFWTVTSILGYALIPVNLLAALKLVLFFSIGKTILQTLAFLVVIWSTTASTRLIEIGCGLEHQRYLLAYPIALLYTAFVLITIF